MSTDALLQDAPEPIEEVVDAPEVDAPQIDPATEALARQHGWKPESEWKGEPPKYGFVDPDEYLENPRIQVKIQDEKISSLEKTLLESKTEAEKRIERLAAAQAEADKRRAENHKREIARLKEDQRKSVEDMDVDRFDQLAQEIEALGPAPEIEETPKEESVNGYTPLPGEKEAVAAWRSDPVNSWFHSNQYMKQAAVDFYSEAATSGINDPAARLQYMQKRVNETFGTAPAPRPRAAAVDGGGFAARSGTARKLPPEAEAAAKRFVAEGIYKDVAEYAADYFEQNGE